MPATNFDKWMSAHQQQCEEALTTAFNAASNLQPADPICFIAGHLLELAIETQIETGRFQTPVLDSDAQASECSDKWSLDAWIRGAGVHRVIASALRIASSEHSEGADAELTFIKRLKSRQDLAARLRTGAVIEGIIDLMWGEVEKLQSAGAAMDDIQNKFAGAIEGSYSGLDTFYGGLESVIGSPNPKLMEAMATEHTHGPGTESIDIFVTANYGVHTSSTVEWMFIVNDEATPADLKLEQWPQESEHKLSDPTRRRVRRPLFQLLQHAEAHNEQLRLINEPILLREEIIAANAYTGPLFAKYNGLLRGLQSDSAFLRNVMIQLCCSADVFRQYIGDVPPSKMFLQATGSLSFDDAKRSLNRYPTTVHGINSAIVKLGKLTKATKVYRGIAGMALPDAFWQPNRFGIRGGVEAAFMSATLERAVAMGYAAGGAHMGIVLEVQQGMINRGASISWLSQYPHEREILFGPLTGIEVLGTRVDGSVVVIECNFSMNLSALTLEQVFGRRRKLASDAVAVAVEEVRAQVEALQSTERAVTAAQSLENALRCGLLAQDPAWFNDDANLSFAVEVVTKAKSAVLRLALDERMNGEGLMWLLARRMGDPSADLKLKAQLRAIDPVPRWLSDVAILRLATRVTIDDLPSLTRVDLSDCDTLPSLTVELDAFRKLNVSRCTQLRSLCVTEPIDNDESGNSHGPHGGGMLDGMDDDDGLVKVNAAGCTALGRLRLNLDLVDSLDVTDCSALAVLCLTAFRHLGAVEGLRSCGLERLMLRTTSLVERCSDVEVETYGESLIRLEAHASGCATALPVSRLRTLDASGCARLTSVTVHDDGYQRMLQLRALNSLRGPWDEDRALERMDDDIRFEGKEGPKVVKQRNRIDATRLALASDIGFEPEAAAALWDEPEAAKPWIDDEWYRKPVFDICPFFVNGLTEIKLVGCSGLSKLCLRELAALTALDVSHCVALRGLTLSELPQLHKLYGLDKSCFRACLTVELDRLDRLTELDLGMCATLRSLTICQVPRLAALLLGGGLATLRLEMLPAIAALDLSGCLDLQTLTLHAIGGAIPCVVRGLLACTALHSVAADGLDARDGSPHLNRDELAACKTLRTITLGHRPHTGYTLTSPPRGGIHGVQIVGLPSTVEVRILSEEASLPLLLPAAAVTDGTSRGDDTAAAQTRLWRMAVFPFFKTRTDIYAHGVAAPGEEGMAAARVLFIETPNAGAKVPGADFLPRIAAAREHSLAVLEGGGLTAWGAAEWCGSSDGQAVLGEEPDFGEFQLRPIATDGCSLAPHRVNGMADIVSVATGPMHSLGLTLDGRVYAWGSGAAGKLGLRLRQHDVRIPRQIDFRTKRVMKVACGFVHSAAVSEAGEVLTWGAGGWGNLGLGPMGDEPEVNSPKIVERLLGKLVISVACGRKHTLFLTCSGRVYATGFGADGCLGFEDARGVFDPREVVGMEEPCDMIAAGELHSMALTMRHGPYSVRATDDHGRPWGQHCFTWGRDDFGQLGHSNVQRQLLPRCVKQLVGTPLVWLSAGSRHSAACSASGMVFTWGCGMHGMLGHGSTISVPFPRPVTMPNSLRFVQVECGERHTLAVTDDGQLYAWGDYGRQGAASSTAGAQMCTSPVVVDDLECRVRIKSPIQPMPLHQVDLTERFRATCVWEEQP